MPPSCPQTWWQWSWWARCWRRWSSTCPSLTIWSTMTEIFIAGQAAERRKILNKPTLILFLRRYRRWIFSKIEIYFILCPQSGLCGETSNDWWIHRDLILTREEISRVNIFFGWNLWAYTHIKKYAPLHSYLRFSLLQKKVILIFLLKWVMVKGKNENEGTSKEARSLRRVIVTSAGFCQPQPWQQRKSGV